MQANKCRSFANCYPTKNKRLEFLETLVEALIEEFDLDDDLVRDLMIKIERAGDKKEAN